MSVSLAVGQPVSRSMILALAARPVGERVRTKKPMEDDSGEIQFFTLGVYISVGLESLQIGAEKLFSLLNIYHFY